MYVEDLIEPYKNMYILLGLVNDNDVCNALIFGLTFVSHGLVLYSQSDQFMVMYHNIFSGIYATKNIMAFKLLFALSFYVAYFVYLSEIFVNM